MTRSALVAAGAGVVLVAGVGALTLRLLDRQRPLPVGEAVDRFRASESPTVTPSGTPAGTPSAGAPATPGGASSATPSATASDGGPTTRPPRPSDPAALTPEGVYVYATTGHETAKTAVGTSRHDYPADTTVTVHHGGCGESVRWDATKDRWDEVTVCPSGDATRVTAYRSYHRFYGQAQENDFTCGGTSWLRPPVTTRGYRWTFDCVMSGSKAHTDARVVGTETVGGARALHVHYDTTLTGANRGTNPQDFWLATDGPYVLRQASVVDAAVDTPYGTITYHEEYDLRLRSRTPRR